MFHQHADGAGLGDFDTCLRTHILDLLAERGAGKSICPSEVARLAGGEGWRNVMAAVCDAAWQLEEQGEVAILQRGRTVTRKSARGPIRIALAMSRVG